MRLSEQQKLFASEFVKNGGNGTEAAIVAKYKNPAVAASRLLRNDKVLAYIDKLNEEIISSRIATAQERQEYWTSLMRGEKVDEFVSERGEVVKVAAKMTDRIKASELLGKSQLDFVEKRIVELSSPADELERLKAIALSIDD